MPYLYLALAVASSGVSGVLYKKVSSFSNSRTASTVLPALWFIPLTLVFLATSLLTGELSFSTEILMPALLAGAAYAVCSFSLLESMRSNSFTFAIIIINLSFVFPILLSVIFLNEQTHLLQFIGMTAAILVIVLTNLGQGKGKNSFLAIVFALLSSLGNGLVDFAIKIQQHGTSGEDSNSFFFFTYLIATVICLAVTALLRLTRHRPEFTESISKKELLGSALGIAACNGICFFAVGLLANHMNAAAEFVLITTLSIVISLALRGIRTKENPTKREVISMVFCAAAIACQCWNLI